MAGARPSHTRSTRQQSRWQRDLYRILSILAVWNRDPDLSIGGDYDPREHAIRVDSNSPFFYAGFSIPDPVYTNDVIETKNYFDVFEFGTGRPDFYTINTTVWDAHEWNITLPSNKTYNGKIGYLGLGPAKYQGDIMDSIPPGILQQLVKKKIIGSNSYSIHTLSALWKQPGSMIFGGYDMTRAIGDVGRWNSSNGGPHLPFLRDIVMGVEQGASPFINLTVTPGSHVSIWQDPDETAKAATRAEGGPDNSVFVFAEPALPYIYLPKGNCEAIAAHLPVTWREDLLLWVWNTQDPQYKKIVSSPGYLGFVIATPEAKNLTIKVPFPLLNLTLESPIVDTPTPYFPCRTQGDNTTTGWALGRAFLQAAFYHRDFDGASTTVSLAQAPGPGVEQEVIQAYNTGDAIKTSDISQFAKSWESHWTVLDENGKPQKKKDGTNDKRKGLAEGAIAGIVVGVMLALAAAALALVFWRRRANSKSNKAKQGGGNYANGEHKELQGSGNSIYEAPEVYLLPEAGSEPSGMRHEMSSDGRPMELPE